MKSDILPNLITGISAVLGALIGTIGVVYGNSKRESIKIAEREQAQKDQINQILNEQIKIKERLDSHNGYAEKFANASKEIAVINERQKSVISAIEKMQKDIDYLKSDRCKI